MRNLWLLITLIVVLGGYGLFRKYWEQRRPSFQTELIEMDTSQVSLIQINPPGEETEILLRRLEDRWIMTVDNTNTLAKNSAVQKILRGVSQLQTKYLAEAEPNRWEVYDLNPAKATAVKIYVQDQLKESFTIGAYHYNQQTEKSVSYLRLKGQNEVYAIDGGLLSKGDLGLKKLRDRRIMEFPAGAKVSSLWYETPDTSWQFVARNGNWEISAAISFDTIAFNKMLAQFGELQGTQLAGEFDELQADSFFHHRVRIQMQDPSEWSHTLTCYRDSSRKQPYVIHSSQFPTSWWLSDSSGIYNKISLSNLGLKDFVIPQ